MTDSGSAVESFGGFTRYVDDSGEAFYVDDATEASSWDEPPSFTAVKAAAVALAAQRRARAPA